MSLSFGRCPTAEETRAIIIQARLERDRALAAALLRGLNRLAQFARNVARGADEQYLAQARDLRDLGRRVRLIERSNGRLLLDPGR